jgi:hypothetical protein
MRERRRATINDLRVAIDCMPRATRAAMLEALGSNEIIVGAYTDGSGICPMLAAHRAGGRTDLISFAKAWDSLAFRGSRARSARKATARELLILKTHLELSLLEDEGPSPDLAAAMSEHRELIAQRGQRGASEQLTRRLRPRPGDPDRSRELRSRSGWAWTRVVRRYDDYQRAVQRLESEHEALRERERFS